MKPPFSVLPAYKVQRRKRPAGTWFEVATVIESEIILSAQERGKDCEYRGLFGTKAGES